MTSAAATHAWEPIDLAGIPDAPDADLASFIADDGAVSDGWLSAFGYEVADAASDPDALAALLEMLRAADRKAALAGNVTARAAYTACAQIVDAFAVRARVIRAPFPASSERGRFLLAVASKDGATGEEIGRAASMDPTQVSRTGRRLVSEHWVFARRYGRFNSWALTPAGAAVAPLVAATYRGADQ